MQMRASDLLESLETQEQWERERDRAELLIDAARIAAGADPAKVFAAALQEGEPSGDGEEVFDTSDSEWVAPSGEDELAMLMAMQQVTVPNADLAPAPGAPLADDGEERQWL